MSEKKRGTLIVVEGTDGSGKSTQFGLLCRRLEREGRDFQHITFPQYAQPSSALVRMYLAGEFGSRPGDVNPYAASSFYAVDRYASYKTAWGARYERGGLVLADRYTTSNAVHQASKLPREEQPDFFRWLYEYEFDRLGLPRPDLVVYLDLPTERAVQLLRSREAATQTSPDIHEVDRDYLASCRAAALAAVPILGWERVNCLDGERLRTVEEIHSDIWKMVEECLTRTE